MTDPDPHDSVDIWISLRDLAAELDFEPPTAEQVREWVARWTPAAGGDQPDG